MAGFARRATGGVVGVALLAAGAAAYLHYRAGPSSTDQGLVLYGNVDVREAELAFNIGGRVESMRVEEGDRVAKGELLATLEPDLYKAELEAAQARMAAREAEFAKLQSGSRPEEISRARNDVQAIHAELENARSTLARTERLMAETYASEQKRDDDRALVRQLEARLDAARQELALAIQGPRAEDIAVARAELKAAQAEVALGRTRLDYCQLRAAEDGVVTTRIVEPGAVVQPNSPVYALALKDPVWVRTYVSEPDLGRIRPGMKAEIHTDSHPERPYEGWIGYISPTAEFTPKSVETPDLRTSLVYRLRVFVKNPDDALRQGMPVTIRLPDGAVRAASGS